MKKKYHNKIRRRMLVVGICFTLALMGVLAKAAHIQIWQGADLTKKAQKGFKGSLVSRGKRGGVFDIHHRKLAITLDTESIGAHPGQMKKPRAVAKRLAKVLRKNRKTLSKQLDTKHPFVWIKRQATHKEVAAVKALSLPGVVFKPAHSRFYPNQSLAGQVIGFTGVDGSGLEGIEFHYDTYLRGQTDQFTVLRDAKGRGFDAEQAVLPNYTGNNVILTIDANIQFVAEQALEATVNEFDALSGMALVMEPSTGAILAMAHYPFIDPNNYQGFKRERWRNRIVTDSFEPGSTMKIFTAAAAIESKSCSSQSIFYCENGAYRIGPNVIHDTHPRGWLSVTKIVKYSSNIGASKVAAAMGKETFYQILNRFGFGSKTGIDCPGETTGRLVSPRYWKPIDMANIAFGQGVAVSAIQLVAAVSAIANDGILMKPYLVQAVTDPNGRIIKNTAPVQVRRVISSRSAQTVRRMMATVVDEGGTGVKAALTNYTVGGKTGTAQKIDPNGSYSKKRFIASFVGLAPIDHPRAVVLVAIDEPLKRHYGGTVAAPAFKRITKAALGYLSTSPSNKSAHLSPMVRKAGT
jgi:cell division protein FtsI (penicillin-binding protein 3)